MPCLASATDFSSCPIYVDLGGGFLTTPHEKGKVVGGGGIL